MNAVHVDDIERRVHRTWRAIGRKVVTETRQSAVTMQSKPQPRCTIRPTSATALLLQRQSVAMFTVVRYVVHKCRVHIHICTRRWSPTLPDPLPPRLALFSKNVDPSIEMLEFTSPYIAPVATSNDNCCGVGNYEPARSSLSSSEAALQKRPIAGVARSEMRD